VWVLFARGSGSGSVCPKSSWIHNIKCDRNAELDQNFASCVSSLTKAAFFYGITVIVWATILRPGLQVGLSFLKDVLNVF
jgi:hypothetical protein